MTDRQPAVGLADASRSWPRPGFPVLVRDLMTATVVTADPTATVQEIAHLLLTRDVRLLPVVDIDDRLVGVVSEADLVCREGFPTVRSHHLADFIDDQIAEHRYHWAARTKGLSAGEIMTTEVETCEPSEPVSVVSRRMVRRNIRTMPVVDDRRLVGVISRHDILRMFDRPDADVRADVTRLLQDPAWTEYTSEVRAEVLDGLVILTGLMHFELDAQVLADTVSAIPGVTEVANRIKWTETAPTLRYLRDEEWG